GPETRRVGREGLVDPDDVAAGQAELELRVGDDDPARQRVLRRLLVDRQRPLAQLAREVGADELRHPLERDVLVVAGLLLRRRREDRLAQLAAVHEARLEGDAADRAALLILLQPRAAEVAAR